MQRSNTKSREELEEERCLKPGQYPFEIIKADEKKSRKGDDMFAMKIRVYDNDNKPRDLDSWVGGWNELDLLNFMECVGLASEWSSDAVTANMLVGRAGYCKTKIDKRDEDFGPKAVISKYIPLKAGEVAPVIAEPVEAPVAPLSDDDIPF